VYDALQRRLAFHGAAVILLGLLAGFPYALVVTGDLAGSERAWRMAHMEGVTNGLLIFGVAAVAPVLRLGAGARRALVACLLFTAWANTVASVIGAATGNRGLALAAPPANALVFVLFSAAIVTVFAVVGLVMQGGRRGAE